MRFIDTQSGDEFTGRSYREVVIDMKAEAWRVKDAKGPYMREVAARCAELGAVPVIRTKTPRVFLTDLVRAGFLRKGKL